MFHIVYKTTRISTGEYYIGVHSTDNLNDSYFGSGDRIKRIIQKEGKRGLVRETLHECESREAALQLEHTILTPLTLADSLCLNVSVGGKGNPEGNHTISDEARQRLSELHTGKPKSETTRQRISSSYRNRSTKRKSQVVSEETRQKISRAQKGRVVSEETRRKLSEQNKRVWANRRLPS